MPRPEPRPTNPFPLTRAPADSYPLSVGQERLWWLHQVDSSRDQYHIHGGWRFPKALDSAAISVALAGLVRRHEILRTRFVLRPEGMTVQEVLDNVEISVTWAGHDWHAAVDKAATEPFDLARPPLFRVVVADLDSGSGLYMVLHHIVTDRWSMDVLPRDLLELYEAALENRTPVLPELAVQCGDYAIWQRRFLTGDRLQPLLDWWTRTLAGHERGELPLDRPRPVTTDGVGKAVVAEVSQEVTSAMTALAWRSRSTPFIVVMAALAATLGRFIGQSDVVIGAIVSDRQHKDLQDVVGFFVNTVPVRIDLSTPDLTFREIIVRTRDAWLAADAHQDAPFEQVVGALGAGAEPGRNPVFDVAVNHGGDRTGLTELPNAPTWWFPEVPLTARFDLSLTTLPVDGRLRASFLYRPDLYDEEPVAAIAAHYVRLLKRGVTEPDRPLRELDLCAEPPRGHDDAMSAPEATVVERLQKMAAANPYAPAVVGAGGTLSYRELNEHANQLARHLLTHGVGPERVVGVCLEPTIERFVVLLAVVKCGAAYLPLDPGFPADRIRVLLTDADAVLTVVSPSLRDRLPDGAAPVLELGGEPELTGYESSDPPLTAHPDDLAYLISTSGSTGAPKSVAISHRALNRLVAGAPSYLEVGPGTTFLQTGPLSFDVAVLEWAPLAHGGRVVVTDTGTLLEDLDAVVRDHEVTTLKVVSPQLDLLVEQGSGSLSGLRRLVVGGDVVNPKSFAAARDLLPDCQVMASYGPTESTVLATVFDDPSWTSGRVPIGHAIPYTRVYVLDRDLQPAPVGMRGEIYLAGDGLARGYHRRPGLTARSFVPDPYGPPGARMYRTGDLGRYLASGEIDFLGRADQQVKIRGFRIETSEIEHVLLRHPDITSAVVARVELETGPALAAYVAATGSVDQTALRRELRATLPAYMVPDHIVVVPRIPLTANHKVDRAALPPVITERPTELSVPVTGLEVRIAEAWSAVLDRTVPATGDFFELGGHSLLVPRATAAVRRLLGREVPLRLMMAHRTPAVYAAALVRESLPDLGAANREHRLERRSWRSRRLGGDRRVDLFASAGGPAAGIRTVVVLDGAEFVDIMRLPAILDRQALEERAPMTAAVFLSPADWSGRRTELLDDAYADVLADELVPLLRSWLGDRWRPGPVIAVGASLGAVAAIRAALRRRDCFSGAIALSGPLTEHPLGHTSEPARFFLSASGEEADIVLDDGLDLVAATERTGAELAGEGHAVRCAYGSGGHTYAAWEAMLPEAITWVFDDRPE